MSINVIRPGEMVLIGGDRPEIKAMVTSVQVNGPELAVLYCVAWFDNNNRHSEWLNACEITQSPKTKNAVIGFSN